MMSDFSKDDLLVAVREHVSGFSPNGTIERLSGGNINYLWRIEGKPHSLIAKYAPPYIAAKPDVQLSDERIDFEARALSLFAECGRLQYIAGQEIRPPARIAFDPDRPLLIMEDIGKFSELNQIGLRTLPVEWTGERLGRFIGQLHSSTFQDDELRQSFQNIEIQNVRNQLQYQPANEYAHQKDESFDTQIKKKSSDLGNRLLKPGKCLIMGDLWPPSVCVNQEGEIRLLDWKFVHFGRPLQDVGHFAAHCWMQQHVTNDSVVSENWKMIWHTFWAGYKTGAELNFEQLFDARELQEIGVHIGTEILIRTFGPFKEGYIYDSFDEHNPDLNEAKEMAVKFILQPESSAEIFGFKNS